MLYLPEHRTSLSLISFTISLAGTERELIDLQFPGCLSIIKKIVIVLSMPEALPLWRSQSTSYQGEGRAGWGQPFATFTVQVGKEKGEQVDHEVHVTAGYGAATLFLTLSTLIPFLKSVTSPQGWGRADVCPSASFHLKAEKFQCFSSWIQPCY